VGFQAPRLTQLSANPLVAGAAVAGPGGGYATGSYSLDFFNAGAGGRQGFWLFATAPTTITYSGTDDGQGNFVPLGQGYNLASFCTDSDLPTASLTATQNGQSVPLSTVVLSPMFEVGANSNTPVPIPGGTIRPGRAYWVFSNAANVRLVAGPAPSPSPSPVVAASLELVPAATASLAVGSTLQFTLRARLADGTTRDVTAEAAWSSADPSAAALLSPGLFKGLNPFLTRITARFGGLTAEADLTVFIATGPPVLPSPSPAGFVALGSVAFTPAAGASTFSLTTTASANVGDLVLVSTGASTAALLGVRVVGDSAGNAYDNTTVGSSAASHALSGFQSFLTNPLPAGGTINLDLIGGTSNTGDAYVAVATAFSGWTARDRFDPDVTGVSFGVGPSTSLTTPPTSATTTAPELVFAFFSCYAGTPAAGPTFTAGPGYTAANSASAVSAARSVSVFPVFRIATTTGTQTATGTLNTPFTYDNGIVTYR